MKEAAPPPSNRPLKALSIICSIDSMEGEANGGVPDVRPGHESDRVAIRSAWQLPAFCHFCQVFRSALGLPSFSPGDLENALLDSYDPDNTNMLLPELFWKLAQCGTEQAKSRKIKAEGFPDWKNAAIKFLRFLYDFDYSMPFHEISCKDKLLMLHSLCDRALDAYPGLVQDSGNTPDEMRLRPIGYDSDKKSYHSFSDDAWIFTEKRKDYISHRLQSCAPVWEVASASIEDLRALCSRLETGDNQRQKELVSYLQNELLTSLEAAERARANRAKLEYRKQLFSLIPKRQSARILTKQEEDDRRRQEEQEEMDRQNREAERQALREQSRIERRRSLMTERELSPRNARAIRAARRPLRSNTDIEDLAEIDDPASDSEVISSSR